MLFYPVKKLSDWLHAECLDEITQLIEELSAERHAREEEVDDLTDRLLDTHHLLLQSESQRQKLEAERDALEAAYRSVLTSIGLHPNMIEYTIRTVGE